MIFTSYEETYGKIDEVKKGIRKELTEKRKMLSGPEKEKYSFELYQNICSLDEFKNADTVMSFWPLENETDVKKINKAVLDMGKTLALPLCEKKSPDMNFRIIRSFDELEKGSYSIYEPKECCPIFMPKDDGKTVCLVPALGYDNEGFRIGYGGGYYDRYLSKYGITAIGVVYHPFITAKLPRSEFDKAVHILVTDREIIRIKR